jgi:putative addiction module killer protein
VQFGVPYPVGYNCRVIEIRQTARYRRWFEHVRDREARFRILARVAAVGEGLSELRIDYGPGYRVYYRQTGTTAATLLAGGTKRTQRRDIERAIELAREVTDDEKRAPHED